MKSEPGVQEDVSVWRFLLLQVLRIMRQFMTHSNQASRALSAHPQDLAATKVAPTLPVAPPYQVLRSRRKTMVIHVRHARVEVRAPHFVSDREIERFVENHREWIQRQLDRKAQQDAQRLDLREAGSIFYKGHSLRVRLQRATRESIEVTDTEFVLFCRNTSGTGPERALQRCLLAQAQALLPARSRALAQYLGVGDKLREVVFRKTKTKWGHCTASGRIQFNWLIMLAPDAIVDYMICHEVCHLHQMNHSARFWSLVESVCPDYRTYVKWLRKHEHRLWL